MMDQLEKIRMDQTKLKKVKDDNMNRSNEFDKIKTKKEERDSDKKTAD